MAIIRRAETVLYEQFGRNDGIYLTIGFLLSATPKYNRKPKGE